MEMKKLYLVELDYTDTDGSVYHGREEKVWAEDARAAEMEATNLLETKNADAYVLRADAVECICTEDEWQQERAFIDHIEAMAS